MAEWTKHGSLLMRLDSRFQLRPGEEKCIEIFGVDLDGTLISGEKFLDPRIPQILVNISKKYHIAIFTNQGGLKKAETEKKWMQKIDRMLASIPCPIDIFAAEKKDIFRKPNVGMLAAFLLSRAPSTPYYQGYFCGDANSTSHYVGDSDLKLAQATGLVFLTPQQLLSYTST